MTDCISGRVTADILRRSNEWESRIAPDVRTGIAAYDAPEKDLGEIGAMPPPGHVPKQMYAWSIRRGRHGEPDTAMQVAVVETPDGSMGTAPLTDA